MGAAERTGVAHGRQRLPRAVPNRPARRYVGYLTPCHPLWHCYGARYMASPGFRVMTRAIVAALSGRAAAAANSIGAAVARRSTPASIQRGNGGCCAACPYTPSGGPLAHAPRHALAPPIMAARRAGGATPAGGTARAPALVPGCFSHGPRQGRRHAGSLARHEKCRSARTERHGALRPEWPVARGTAGGDGGRAYRARRRLPCTLTT